MKNRFNIAAADPQTVKIKYDLFRQTSFPGSGVVPLDGEWDFFYSHLALSSDPARLPAAEKFTGRMVTPGYWDDWYELFDEQDFFGDMARFNPDYRKPHFPMANSLTPHASSNFLIGTGYYRKLLEIDLAEDSVATLSVGPAMWDCMVFCNRQFAGKSAGYSTASEFDLSKLLKKNEPNEIIVAVCNVHDDGGAYCRKDGSHDGEERGARPGQHRGLAAQGYQSERAGICGGVALKLTRSGAISDAFLYLQNNRIFWNVELKNGIGKKLQWRLIYQHNVLAEGSRECTADSFVFDMPIPENAPAWSDESPELMQVELALYSQESLIDFRHNSWGMRSFTREGTALLLNSKSVYLRGVTEHCYFPESCNPHFSFDKYMQDLGKLKNAGFNFIRCHTWCPPEPFYEACDALGFLVQTELPVVWSDEEALAILRMIRRHPSAVILCEGNEKILDMNMLELLRKLAAMMRKLAPGMLFNPQEAMRGIEYDFTPDQKILETPVPHDPERFAITREFSDVYGALCGSIFSYCHEQFPGAEAAEKIMSIYKLPCLAHEIGILGGALDFTLEKRYENTFIGTDLFAAARANMQKHGVMEKALEYYQINNLFIASLRKQLIENLRSCGSICGYDYLGGIDTHWHLTGYSCGIFNEFYEEKYGESVSDILRYNNASVLLWSAGKNRRFTAGESLAQSLAISHYGKAAFTGAVFQWSLQDSPGRVIASECINIDSIASGGIRELCKLQLTLPQFDQAQQLLLKADLTANGKTLSNQWKLWVFPAKQAVKADNCRITTKLDDADIEFMKQGGNILLTDNFPAATEREMFRPHTSGRSLLHAGAILREHPIWRKFPAEGFADWQFFPMMDQSYSIVYDSDMPEFKVLFELIPSFKRIRHKTMLTEFQVGQGRLMLCSLHLNEDDPAGSYLKYLLLEYLSGDQKSEAPDWAVEKLRERLHNPVNYVCQYRKIDAGGRPVD